MWKVIFCLLLAVFCCSHIVAGEESSHSRMSDFKTMQSKGSSSHATYVKVVDKSSSNNFNRQASPYSDSPTSKEPFNKDRLTGKAYYNGVSKGIADQEFYSQTLLDQSQRLSIQTEKSEGRAQQASSKQTTTPFPFINRVTRLPGRRECTDCVLNGVTYKGHSRFEYQEDCLHHRCICHCDGSWDCPAGSVTDMCERESMNNPKCRTCDVQDRQITGNSYFDMTEGCIKYSNCICRCNGSWECSDDRSENICAAGETTKTPPVTECQKCFAHGLYRRGNSRFSHTDDCFEYDCECFCDGQWECPSERAQNICDYEDESPPDCSECEVNGEFFEGNSKFKQTTGCVETTCDCHCDGTYDCPVYMMKNICNKNETRECSRCEVSETESYPGDSKFTLSKECIHYDCTCNCDGSWSCPGKDARNLCKGERPGGCRNCEISDKEFYNGNTNFTLQKGCIGYNCVCNCDGSWNCPGEDARDTCKGEIVGGCKSCVLSDREYYPGDTDFEMKQGCILYQCRCNCDGGWNCPGYKAKDICQNPEAENDRRLETCKACKLSNGERYEPNTKFQLERGCYQYECNCNCDGLYDCPDESATNICDVSPEDKEEFRTRQEKEFQRQRLREQEMMRKQQRKEAFERQRRREQEIREARQRYRFEQTRKEVTSTQRVNSQTEEDSQESDEQERRGREKEQQERNEEAKKERLRYEMERERQIRLQQEKILQAKLQRQRQERDRVQRERTDRTRDETRRETHASNKHDRTDHTSMEMIPNVDPYNSQPCLKCSFAGETHPGNTEFEYKRGCYTYQCTCDCNGRWKCDRNNVIYTCDKSRTEGNVRRTTNSRTIANQDSSPTYVVKTERKPQTAHSNVQRSREAGSAYSSASASSSASFSSQSSINTPSRKYSTSQRRQYQTPEVSRNKIEPHTRENKPYSSTSSASASSSAAASFSSQSSINTPSRKYSTSQRRQYQTPEVSSHKTETHTRENKPSISRETGSQGVDTTSTKYQVSQESGDQYQSPPKTNYPFFPRKTSHNVHATRRVIYPSSQTGYQQVHSSDSYRNPFLSPRVNSHQSSQTSYYTVPLPPGNNYPSPQGAGYNVQTSTRYIFPAAHRGGTHSVSTSSNFPIRQTHSLPVGESVYPTAPVGSVNTDSCQVCLADGQNYNVNDLFDMDRGCVIYKCRCLCNGNYRCAITPNPTCNERSVETKCGNCHVHGLIYPGNMGFQQKRGCYEYTCQCKCDGTYECPDEKKVNLCPSKDAALTDPYNTQSDCGTCTIEGNSYTGNSQFKIYEKCLVYSCDCSCSGIWKCSAEHAPGCLSANGGVTIGYPTFNTTGSCSECLVNKQPHSANSDFKLKQGCLEYACKCNCDGTWYCPTQSPKHVCDASLIQRQATSCQSCDVRGTVYPADATFVLREGCHQHTCVCNCDGTWRCPNNSTINVCESSTRTVSEKSNCKECAVNGITYMSNSDFKFREGCSQYNCKCFCNGSWECPPDKTENMCRSPDYRIDGCRECLVNNRSYPGGSPFNYREGCWEFNCMCSCDGKWSCPPGRSVDICEKVGSVSSRCRPCVIESKVIKSKSTFNLRQGCTEYLCDCECNGNWTCPVERSINTCELGGIKDSSDKISDKQPSKGCEVGNKTYYTRLFGYTEQCIQYTCICYDNGAWRCPPNRSRKVC